MPKIRQKRRVSGFLSPKTKLRMTRPGAPALRGRGRPGGSGPRVPAGCEETKRKTKPHHADLPIFWLGAVVHHHTCATTTSLTGAGAVHRLQVSLPDAECERSVTVAIHTYVSSRCRGALTGRLVASLS